MATPFTTLDHAVPIVLLPVRLETRWFAKSDTEHELRVRVYPDALHVTRPQERVSPSELDDTQAYWRARAGDGETATTTASAWERLSTSVGIPRAAWLASTLEPQIAADGTLTFPTVPTVDPELADSDTTEAIALPDRFVVMGYIGPRRVFAVSGSPVPASLPVGPTDRTAPDRAWQVDFDAAVAVGMGIRVTVGVAQAQRLTRLAVVGVRESDAPEASARVFADLVERHAIDGGAALMAVGTPTNHTGSERVGDPLRPSGVAPPAGSDGVRVASALGLEPADLRFVANNEIATDAAARAMNTVIWPATWDYFLEQIVAPICSTPTRGAAREMFSGAVRARGPFPTFRLGREPYGILPIAPTRLWKNAQGQLDTFAGLLVNLRGRWASASAAEPRLPVAGDPMQTLLDVLARQPTSVRWLGRSTADVEIALPQWLGNLGLQSVTEAQTGILRQDIVSELTALGFDVASARQIQPLISSDQPFDVDLPLASRRRFTPLQPAVLPATYLNAIAQATPEALRAHTVAGSSPRTLLYLLARDATLRVLARAADGLLTAASGTVSTASATPASSAAVAPEPTVITDPAQTVWTKFSQRADGFGDQPVSRVLSLPTLPVDAFFSELRQHRAALHLLAGLPPDDVERLAAEAIDLASHRLDAWTTALATERLFDARATGVKGVYLGAYGWVEGGSAPAQVATDGGDIGSADSQGFVHAPSLEHARAGAVLRAGFNARPTGDLAINLSSDRVRHARWLLAELSAGQSLAALLGYRIERLLVDNGLGSHIDGLRTRFPLAESAEGDVARPHLDGLAAHEAWAAAPPTDVLGPIAAAIAEVVDALADLLLAETVHQHVNGKPTGVARLLDAVEAGTAVPSDADVVRSPVPASLATSQIVLSLDAASGAPAWPAGQLAPRAVANPSLEAWVAALLPPLSGLQATLRLKTPDGSDGTATADVSALGVCALDIVALSADHFVSSPLAALLAGLAPPGSSEVTVEPAPALEAAHTTARAVVQTLRTARPRSGDTPPPEWATRRDSAVAALARDRDAITSADDARRRAAALLGAPAVDPDRARQFLDDLVSRAQAEAPEDALRLISGLPPEGLGPSIAGAVDEEFATASARATWLADLSRVRPAVDGLELLDLAHRQRHGDPLPLAGYRVTGTGQLDERRAVIVGSIPATDVVRGLILDEWAEATPRAEVTSGLAFHHDSPSSRAPQAILVAVPPDPTSSWSLDVLDATIAEALELASARLARPSAVWGTLLPAIYLAENLDDDTISTPLSDAAIQTVVTDA